jgi:hypothetical protein
MARWEDVTEMPKEVTSIYIPIETLEKLKSMGKEISEIIDKPVHPYQVIQILMTLQLNDYRE